MIQYNQAIEEWSSAMMDNTAAQDALQIQDLRALKIILERQQKHLQVLGALINKQK